MKPNYPLEFHPILMERIWGGCQLNSMYQKGLPTGKKMGESWEISDRPEGVSVIANGPLAGINLRQLMEHDQRSVIGDAHSWQGKFPLLVKILDAAETLSLQVHPPKELALALNGEPKTEMWYVTYAQPQAEIFVGLKKGVTRSDFEQKLQSGSVSECFHRIKVREGDGIYLPSGRVHALGAGITLFEIQQNSNTTYRVFDWNRTGLDGKPRELHVKEGLASIDFKDYEPGLVSSVFENRNGISRRTLVDGELFKSEIVRIPKGGEIRLETNVCWIIGGVSGCATINSEYGELNILPGRWGLIPAACGHAGLQASNASEILFAQPR